MREQICRAAKSSPQRLELPLTTWSLTKLAEYLARRHTIKISVQMVRQVLHEVGVRWQATKTWKASKDPELAAKKDRILALYGTPPPDERVICVDEFGPLNLQPRPGRGRFPTRSPARLWATYYRDDGVRHMFAALDLAIGKTLDRLPQHPQH